MVWLIIFIVGTAAAWYLMHRAKSSPPGSPFSATQKFLVLLTLMASPIVGWCIYFFGWGKLFPKRRGWVSVLFILGFIADLALGFVLGLLLAGSNAGLIKEAAQAPNLEVCLSYAAQVQDPTISASLQNACHQHFATTTQAQ